MIKIVVLISGNGSNLQAIIDKKVVNIQAVISNKAEAYGLEKAKKNNIKTHIIEHQNLSREDFDKKLQNTIEIYQPDLIVLAGFMRILTTDFINAFAKKIADHVQDNARDFHGPGDYRSPFIEKMNQRMEDYSEFSFSDGKPGFNFTLYLGNTITEAMGKKDSKWISDHVQAIEIPELLQNFDKGISGLGIGGELKGSSNNRL